MYASHGYSTARCVLKMVQQEHRKLICIQMKNNDDNNDARRSSDVLLARFVYTPYYTWNLLNSFIYWHEPSWLSVFQAACTYTKTFRFPHMFVALHRTNEHPTNSVKRIFDECRRRRRALFFLDIFPSSFSSQHGNFVDGVNSKSYEISQRTTHIHTHTHTPSLPTTYALARVCLLPQIKMRITNQQSASAKPNLLASNRITCI